MGFGGPEITLIKESWAVVQTLPATTVGGLLFKHIFEQADVSKMFSFGRVDGFDPSPEAVAENPDVQKHGAKVVETVGVAISMLTDLDKLVPVLKDLGAKHANYGVAAAHYPVVGGAFLKTLSVGLGEAYTPEVAAAYTAMWGVVESTMLAGASEATKKPTNPAGAPGGNGVHSWGGYATPTTPDLEALTRASQISALDWYANADTAARG